MFLIQNLVDWLWDRNKNFGALLSRNALRLIWQSVRLGFGVLGKIGLIFPLDFDAFL